jgi:hypothetical protein
MSDLSVNQKQTAYQPGVENQGANQVDQTSKGAGGGNVNASYVTPEVTEQVYNQVQKSLTKLAANVTGDMLDILLAKITKEMKDRISSTEKERAEVETDKKQAQMEEKRAKLEEATQKIEKQMEKEANASIWDKIKMAFSVIGAAIAMALGAVMIATGVGAVAGGMMMAAGAIALVGVIDGIVREETGMGIGGHLGKALGASEEDLAKWDMGFGIALAVLGIGASIISAATGNFSGIANSVMMAMRVAQVAQGLAEAGGAAADIGAGANRYQAAEHSAEAKESQADAKEIDALMQMLDEVIDQAISQLLAASDRFNTVLDDIVQTMNDRGDTVSRARFTG